MDERLLRKFITDLEKSRRENPLTKEQARAMLIEEGVLNKDGSLAEPYASGREQK